MALNFETLKGKIIKSKSYSGVKRGASMPHVLVSGFKANKQVLA